MSVNIFGASGMMPVEKPATAATAGTDESVDLQEIEQKISSLNDRKFDKTGGYISGDVSLQIRDDETTRTFGLTNMGTGKDFVVMLGSPSNAIRHQHGQPIEFKSDHGIKFNDDIIMSNCSIVSLRSPTELSEAATKGYVDLLTSSIDPNQFVRKSGDSITGDLGIYFGNEGDTTRVFGVSDIGPSKSVVLMLGSLNNAIYHEHSKPIEFKSEHGVKFNDDIIMSNCSIGSLREPVQSNECATKSYVDTAVAAATAAEPEDSIDISAILAKKLDKTGGTLTGDLEISFGSDDSRTFGISQISQNKIVNLNLGNSLNGITHTSGYAMHFKSENGVRFVCGGESVCQLGCDTSCVQVYQNIFMNGNRIVGLPTPIYDQDACTKSYLDGKYVKCQSGHINTLLDNNNNKHGFIVTASSEKPNLYAYRAFAWTGEWVSANTAGPIWIQIQCPFAIRIHKIGLRGRKAIGEKVKSWNVQGSNDGNVFTDLLRQNTILDHSTIQFYDVTCIEAYLYYKLNILGFEGTAPGLNYFQIYSLDPIT